MINNVEFEELKRICEEKKISPEQLLEEKVAPLQERILKSQGEVIGALTRDYEQCSHGMTPVHYSLRETLYTGLVTSETKFPIKGDSFGVFLLGIDKPYSLEINPSWERDFREGNDGSFGNWMTDHWRLLYFMDKPAEVPEDSWQHGCFGSHSTAFPTEKARLELYIANQQAIPFLQQNLEGWRYLQLSGLLGYDLPLTDEILKKIEDEQLKIFDEMRTTEVKVRSLTNEKERRVELTKATDGAIHHGAYIELTDEFVENMRYNPQIRESRDRVLGLLKTAIKRGYHETGMQVDRQLDAGVVMRIDLKDFFTQRKAMFEL
ncbi:MAG: hypothetical protein ABIE36_00525 [Candidatus Diapherotrites archaeon]